MSYQCGLEHRRKLHEEVGLNLGFKSENIFFFMGNKKNVRRQRLMLKIEAIRDWMLE